ncbi:hypothetical protein HYPSUDRAFT_828586 [Hypholoma sublateritium FD-334 SS-4]|uniref:Uncharacterized protein n=1 Tax=Hypholoma sublateritium (strain FD-334 SS-4) TaxID=945553 RepID=A0A0D2L088_HYPSF|nr:hypothetical protein HYPSUDRAFT_828586 [Hypholoma sublateritium FD-334 SS-4]
MRARRPSPRRRRQSEVGGRTRREVGGRRALRVPVDAACGARGRPPARVSRAASSHFVRGTRRARGLRCALLPSLLPSALRFRAPSDTHIHTPPSIHNTTQPGAPRAARSHRLTFYVLPFSFTSSINQSVALVLYPPTRPARRARTPS